MQSPISPRKATFKDLDPIANISLQAYQEYRNRLTVENWHKMQQSLSHTKVTASTAQFYVAEIEKTIVGAIAYYSPGKSNPRFFDDDWASLRLLAVTPNFRGRGIGKLLTTAGIERAKSDKATGIGLYTSEAMTIAQKMYGDLGFQRGRELPMMLGLRYWLYLLEISDYN